MVLLIIEMIKWGRVYRNQSHFDLETLILQRMSLVSYRANRNTVNKCVCHMGQQKDSRKFSFP